MKALALALLLGVVTSAMGATVGWGYESGASLLARCQGDDGDQKFCLGYVVGVVDTHNAWVSYGYVQRLMCKPDDVDGPDMRTVVVRYLEANPADAMMAASTLVFDALGREYPCEE